MPFPFRRAPEPEPTSITVEHEGRRFDIGLRRRVGARRVTLRVSSATGAILLTLPEHAKLSTAQAFVDAHGGWLAARVARLPERVPLGPGSLVPLRGVPHRVVHWSKVRSAPRTSIDSDGRPIIAVAGDDAGVPGRVRRFLVGEAQTDLRAAVDRHTAALGLAARRIAIRDTTSRWGSCSSTGTLSFSWRLVLAPPLVLDYLAAHEVAHLKELNHSHRFWKLVHDLCPATEQAENWLKRHGTELHKFG